MSWDKKSHKLTWSLGRSALGSLGRAASPFGLGWAAILNVGVQVPLPKGMGEEWRRENGHPKEAGGGYTWECESCREPIFLKYNEEGRKIPQGAMPL